MPKYLIFASYSAEGVRGFQKEKGTGRRAAVAKAMAGVGGKLEQMYFTFGEDDVVMIVDAPDNGAIMAVSVAAASSGLCRMKTASLVTVDEADQAIDRHVKYPTPDQ